MAKKRFTDIEIWDMEWFMDLKPKLKCLIRYLFDRCDPSGVWKPNWKLASTHIGEDVGESDLKLLPKSQYEILPGGKIFLPDFISFQYGKLSEASPAHKPIFLAIEKNKLSDRVFNRVSNTLQEKDMDKEKETEEEEGGTGETWNTKPSEKEINLSLPKIKSGAVIELFAISKHTDIKHDQVESLWAIFKAQHFTGQKFYRNEGEVYSHFINWCKTQNIEKVNGTHQKSTKQGKNAGNEELIGGIKEKLQSYPVRT